MALTVAMSTLKLVLHMYYIHQCTCTQKKQKTWNNYDNIEHLCKSIKLSLNKSLKFNFYHQQQLYGTAYRLGLLK